jgi:rfaE bifunctional protein nucleotidyltransferase chain/domain
MKSAPGTASNQYDGPPSPSKPTRDIQINGFGEPSYEPHNTSSRATIDRPVKPRRAACMNDKIATLPQLASRVAGYRTAGKSIVFTNGCFDLLHVGHVTYLQEAAEFGDILIVAINSDAGVRRLKGPQRPVIAESDRAAMLASLACVDHVLIFDEDTPHRLLDCLRPDILVKGGTTQEVIGREVVEAYGGRVCTTRAVAASSTTEIVEGIQKKSLSAKNEAANA